MQHICPICGKEFEGRADKIYCSKKCKGEVQKAQKREKRAAEKQYRKRLCIICGEEFIPTTGAQLCCSPKCSAIRKRQLGAEYERVKAQRLEAERKEQEQRSKRGASTMDDLARIAREAAEHHMSYGEYIRLMEARGRIR